VAENETLTEPDGILESERYTAPAAPAFVLAWSRDEPRRIGQALLVPAESSGRTFVWGRGPGENEGHERVFLHEKRPWEEAQPMPLSSVSISRKQLEIHCSSEDSVSCATLANAPLGKMDRPQLPTAIRHFSNPIF
jgi:hypothetical protein